MSDARNYYREAAVNGATSVQLVVLLYEQIVDDLRKASKAIREKRIDARTNAINHAIVIIGHLQSNLDYDRGGDVARKLERFYNMLRGKLLEAQFSSSTDILTEEIGLLLDLRDAWTVVNKEEAARSAAQIPPHSASQANASSQPTPQVDWKG
jgi:flagellar secretion chaperone FliS